MTSKSSDGCCRRARYAVTYLWAPLTRLDSKTLYSGSSGFCTLASRANWQREHTVLIDIIEPRSRWLRIGAQKDAAGPTTRYRIRGAESRPRITGMVVHLGPASVGAIPLIDHRNTRMQDAPGAHVHRARGRSLRKRGNNVDARPGFQSLAKINSRKYHFVSAPLTYALHCLHYASLASGGG